MYVVGVFQERSTPLGFYNIGAYIITNIMVPYSV